jgi:16S rRNA (guanine1207-N2)-methyltransferase
MPRRISAVLGGEVFELTSDSGVFAARGLDPGTALLLRSSPPPPGGDCLDLGCGWGAISLDLARRNPAARVWAVDVNSRARDLTRANAAALGLANVVVAAPEEVPEALRFCAMWSNPPLRVGKPVLKELLSYWLGRLGEDGEAWMVISRHLGGDSLAAWLRSEGWAVTKTTSKRGYRVLRVSR